MYIDPYLICKARIMFGKCTALAISPHICNFYGWVWVVRSGTFEFGVQPR